MIADARLFLAPRRAHETPTTPAGVLSPFTAGLDWLGCGRYRNAGAAGLATKMVMAIFAHDGDMPSPRRVRLRLSLMLRHEDDFGRPFQYARRYADSPHTTLPLMLARARAWHKSPRRTIVHFHLPDEITYADKPLISRVSIASRHAWPPRFTRAELIGLAATVITFKAFYESRDA